MEWYRIRLRENFIDQKISLYQDKIDTHITNYQVSLGWFIFDIHVLNLRGPVKEWGYPIGKGGFGQGSTGYTYGRGVYAVKRFMLDT